MLKGTANNSKFFSDVFIFDFLENVRAHSRRLTLKGVLVHVDNICPHSSKKSNKCLTKFRACIVPHPAYSSDSAASDFFLFGTVKTELQNYEIYNRQDLILAINAIVDEIPKDTLNSIHVL
jgi:hypothetical protein